MTNYELLVNQFTKMNEDRDKVLLIVTHGAGIKSILEYHKNENHHEHVDYTAINAVYVDKVGVGKGMLIKEACSKHIKEL
jgi:hypothetical protein